MLFLEEWPWPWPPSSPWQPCSVESDTRSQKSATFHTWTSGCSCALSLSTSSCLSLSVSFSWRHPRKRLSAKLSKGRLDCCFPWPLSYSTWFTGRQCAVSSEEICKISDVVFMRNDACNLKSQVAKICSTNDVKCNDGISRKVFKLIPKQLQWNTLLSLDIRHIQNYFFYVIQQNIFNISFFQFLK